MPWGLGLLALLFVFWRYVGGPGGVVPGSGDRPGDGALPGATPVAFHDSTLRKRVTAQLGSTPPPPPPAESEASTEPEKTLARVSIDHDGGRNEAEVSIALARDGGRESGVVEIMPVPADGDAPGEGQRVPLEAGHAVVPGVKEGDRLALRVVAGDGAILSGELAVRDGEHEIVLDDQARIEGRAIFAEDAPAARVDMMAMVSRAHGASVPVEFQTGEDGSFAFQAPAGYDVLVELRPRGSAAGADVDARVFQRATLEPGETWKLEQVAFERLVPMVQGIVRDDSGKPVAGASVLVLPVSLQARALTARSDAEGRFTVRGPRQSGPLEVFALTEGAAARANGAVSQGTSGIELTIVPAGSIRGTIASPAASLNALLRVELRTELGNVYATTAVLGDGTFEFPHVPPGRYGLVVEAPDRASGLLGGIDVASGAQSADPRLSAVPVATALAPASLRVMDSSGAPVADAAVEVLLSPTATLRSRTGPDGTAEVVVPNGGAPVAVTHASYASHSGPWDGKRVITLSSRK